MTKMPQLVLTNDDFILVTRVGLNTNKNKNERELELAKVIKKMEVFGSKIL